VYVRVCTCPSVVRGKSNRDKERVCVGCGVRVREGGGNSNGRVLHRGKVGGCRRKDRCAVLNACRVCTQFRVHESCIVSFLTAVPLTPPSTPPPLLSRLVPSSTQACTRCRTISRAPHMLTWSRWSSATWMALPLIFLLMPSVSAFSFARAASLAFARSLFSWRSFFSCSLCCSLFSRSLSRALARAGALSLALSIGLSRSTPSRFFSLSFSLSRTRAFLHLAPSCLAHTLECLSHTLEKGIDVDHFCRFL